MRVQDGFRFFFSYYRTSLSLFAACAAHRQPHARLSPVATECVKRVTARDYDNARVHSSTWGDRLTLAEKVFFPFLLWLDTR